MIGLTLTRSRRLKICLRLLSTSIRMRFFFSYPRYVEHTERLHRYQWKVMNTFLPARQVRAYLMFEFRM